MPTFKQIGTALVAQGDLLAQSSTLPVTVCTYTPAVAGTYRVGGYINLLAAGAGTIDLIVSWTDENASPRSIILGPVDYVFGVTSGVVRFNAMQASDIRVAAGGLITVYTSPNALAAASYDMGGNITKLY